MVIGRFFLFSESSAADHTLAFTNVERVCTARRSVRLSALSMQAGSVFLSSHPQAPFPCAGHLPCQAGNLPLLELAAFPVLAAGSGVHLF